jgi:hypothetical protein
LARKNSMMKLIATQFKLFLSFTSIFNKIQFKLTNIYLIRRSHIFWGAATTGEGVYCSMCAILSCVAKYYLWLISISRWIAFQLRLSHWYTLLTVVGRQWRKERPLGWTILIRETTLCKKYSCRRLLAIKERGRLEWNSVIFRWLLIDHCLGWYFSLWGRSSVILPKVHFVLLMRLFSPLGWNTSVHHVPESLIIIRWRFCDVTNLIVYQLYYLQKLK